MERLQERLIAIRRTIHRYPELGEQEVRTSALVAKILKEHGIVVKRLTKTGIAGILQGKRKGSGTFALRADMDALPIQEKTGKSYASTRPGIMHACGHDANTTIVLGAALLLAQRRSEFGGTVKFIFQPNEESSGGAKSMIAAGAMKNPAIDAIVGIHVSPWLPTGTLGLKQGEMMAAVDRFTIDILGVGGHGAYPHLGKDAIVIAAQVITALQTIVSREIDPVEPVVITIGKIEGGERYNILCNRVTLVGTVRTLNERVHGQVRRAMEKKVRDITRAFGAGHRFVYENLGSPLINSPRILSLCRASGEELLGKSRVRLLEKPSMGGEDFAEYLKAVPGCFLYIGAAGKGTAYPWHHERFDIDEKVLPAGAQLLAAIARRYLNS